VPPLEEPAVYYTGSCINQRRGSLNRGDVALSIAPRRGILRETRNYRVSNFKCNITGEQSYISTSACKRISHNDSTIVRIRFEDFAGNPRIEHELIAEKRTRVRRRCDLHQKPLHALVHIRKMCRHSWTRSWEPRASLSSFKDEKFYVGPYRFSLQLRLSVVVRDDAWTNINCDNVSLLPRCALINL